MSALDHAASQKSVRRSADPNAMQNAASNPHESIWVSASAGTGKTKVLTDRVLRLMLPRNDGAPATPPQRILCLTYTKAAASEMSQRIQGVLGEWAVLPLQDLSAPHKTLPHALAQLLGERPSPAQIEAAQKLFAQVMDCPGGLQIMTIHAFCSSVLGRFPLEAGISPHFEGLDEVQAVEIMTQAQARVLARARAEKGSDLGGALERLSAEINEDSFAHLLKNMATERHQLSQVMARFFNDPQAIYAHLCAQYEVMPGTDYIRLLCDDGAFAAVDLLAIAQAMKDGKGKEEQKYAPIMMRWVKATPQERHEEFSQYSGVFLTGVGGVRARVAGKETLENFSGDGAGILAQEAQRLFMGLERAARARSALLTRDLLMIGGEILRSYDEIKRQRGTLDFNDMILLTLGLLRGQSSGFAHLDAAAQEMVPAWVMYKLDQGLDHILIDEAQDTNPEQWQIIEALCAEFFSGAGAKDNALRTMFTVGDVKQSIYGFQRAAPQEFKRMQNVMQRRIDDAGLSSSVVGMDVSFRSTQDVLDVVDQVFAQEEACRAVGERDIRHMSFRKEQAGLVELWPLCEVETQKKDKGQGDLWDLPIEISEHKSASAMLAKNIAQKIKGWIEQDEILPSYGRAVRAGDILILVRTRSALVDMIVRELKQSKIPVSGADRMILSDQLAVQDLVALARFCLLPEDDLNLACVLKSPFLGWDEDDLFALAYGRKTTLWAELQYFDAAKIDAITDKPTDFKMPDAQKRESARAYLSGLINDARRFGIYEFFTHILQSSCPADGQSGMRAMQARLGVDVLDPVEELLNTALNYVRANVDNLQLFLSWLERQKIEIKREMEEGGGQVRIMTVHGAKGLQAPVVIMPDTTEPPPRENLLLWPDKTGGDVPMWTPRKTGAPQAFMDVLAHVKSKSDEERYRLLYVAMTRAADRLYVCGYVAAKRKKEGSWYVVIENAMKAKGGVETLDDGSLRYAMTQQGKIQGEKSAARVQTQERERPQWLFSPVPPEPAQPRPLRPSRLDEDDADVPVISPLKATDQYRFMRGNVTHKLLQFLPDLPRDARMPAAQEYLLKHAQGLKPEIRQGVMDEVFKILEHPDFAPFFDRNAMAEVPITAMMENGRIISGQIDRLCVGADKVWILDYKTNRPPPQRVEGVPKVYLRQMQAYRETMARIYPAREIICGLLWTDGPRLMIL